MFKILYCAAKKIVTCKTSTRIMRIHSKIEYCCLIVLKDQKNKPLGGNRFWIGVFAKYEQRGKLTSISDLGMKGIYIDFKAIDIFLTVPDLYKVLRLPRQYRC